MAHPPLIAGSSVSGPAVGFVGGAGGQVPYTDEPMWVPVVVTHIVRVAGPPVEIRYGFAEQDADYRTGAESARVGGRESDGTGWWGVSERGYPLFIGEEALARRHPSHPHLYQLRSRAPYAPQFLLPTATRTSGRYPAYVQTFDADAGTWASITNTVHLVHPNGGELPTEFTQGGTKLTTERVPAVVKGRLSATGVPVFVALAVPGTLLFWECVEESPVYYYDPQV